jgi:hypothetical protein
MLLDGLSDRPGCDARKNDDMWTYSGVRANWARTAAQSPRSAAGAGPPTAAWVGRPGRRSAGQRHGRRGQELTPIETH